MLDGFSSDVLIMCLIMGTMVICVIAVLLTLEYIKKNRYQREKDRREYIGLDAKREYYEDKIYDLQIRLAENERRWKDTNNLVISGQSGLFSGKEAIKDKTFILDIPFFKGNGVVADDLRIDKSLVFVLTPFIDEEAKTYSVIQEICNDVGLNCRRGDEVYREGNILSHVVKGILKSRVVIVNINGRNPNVFYELGICHAIGKPVIIVSSLKGEIDIPFDVVSKSIIIYKDLDSLHTRLKNELLKVFINDNMT